MDLYFMNGKRSAGMTIIARGTLPVWIMFYFGDLIGEKKIVMSFLKKVLLETYEAGEFFGGRGRPVARLGNLTYENRVCENDFEQFSGYEEVRDQNVKAFWHRYHGFALFS